MSRCQYCGFLPCICSDPEHTEACPDCGRERNACTCPAHACWKCRRPPASCVCGTAEEPASYAGTSLLAAYDAAQAELAQLRAVVADVLGCGNVECSACREALEAALGRAAATGEPASRRAGEPASWDGADTAGTRVGGEQR